MILIIVSSEWRQPKPHLEYDAAEAPHVYPMSILIAECHFRSSVVERLDIGEPNGEVDQVAGTSEVNNLDPGPPLLLEQNVLWFQITMGHALFLHEQKGHQKLESHLGIELLRLRNELPVPEVLVEVDAQRLETQVNVTPVFESP